MNIVLNFADATEQDAAHAAYRATMQAAANFLGAHITNNITVNIKVDLDNFAGTPLPKDTSEGNATTDSISYSDLRNDLATKQTPSANDTTAFNSLATGTSIEGQSSFAVSRALEKAWGLISATDGGQDGEVGMNSSFGTGDTLFAGAIHELTHALGRLAGTNLDLFRFNEDTSGGDHRVFGGAIPATPAFFSIDGGTTKLADFGINSDPGDFLNGGVQGLDPMNENIDVIRGITKVGLEMMDVLGFNVANAAPTVTFLTASVGEDGPFFSQNLLTNASDPESDPLSVKNLDTTVTTARGQHLSLGADYTVSSDGSTITLLNFAGFNHLAQGDTDTAVFNYNVTDNLGASTHDQLTLTIIGSNDRPVANVDFGSAHEKATTSVDVLKNDTDVDDHAALSLVSIDNVTVTSTNPKINGISASSAFTIDHTFAGLNSQGDATHGEINFAPGSTLFAPLALGDTATVAVDYTMTDEHGAASLSTLFFTVIGDNDPPVITSGGGGPAAVYDVRVDFSAITNVVATDVDNGTTLSYSIAGGANADLFSIDSSTGALAFKVAPIVPHNAYQVLVKADDGSGAANSSDTQLITVNVTSDKMAGDATTTPTTFVFHSNGGSTYSNSVNNFDLNHDFLQFDKGMFSANTAAAVLAAATDDHKGDTVIFDQAGDHLTLIGVTKADLTAHQNDILFV
jgi:Bacterial cadherin-like domain/Bacterial Ig domain